MLRPALVVAFTLVSTSLGAQQSLVLRGQVVDAGTGAPLARAVVQTYLAYTADRPSTRILTDNQGRFEVPAGPSFLHISKAGYATTVAAVPADRGQAWQLRVARGAAITGRAVDDTGQPAAGVVIRASSVGAPGVALSSPSYFVARSDDRGDYRIGGLPAGRYAVSTVNLRLTADEAAAQDARLRQGAPLALTATSEAHAVDVVPGGESVAPDVIVPAPSTGCGFASPVVQAGARGAIRGRVTANGSPLRCGTVRLRHPGVMRRVLVTNTDAEGWFEFRGLTAGSYVIEAEEFRHLPQQVAVDIAADQRVDSVTLALTTMPAILGTVVDEHGEPVQGAAVSVFQLRLVRGRLTAMRATTAGGETNDRGEYRLYGLQPGDYFVSASIDGIISGTPAGRPQAYAPTFFPASPDIRNAAPLTVGASDVSGIVVAMAPSTSGRVLGRAFDRGGRPFDGAVTLAVSDRAGGVRLEPRQARVGPDGSFAFENVAPGEYVVQAAIRQSFTGNIQPQFGMQYVIVDGSGTSEVSIRMTAGATIEGRVVVEGLGEPAVRPVVVPTPMPVEFDRSPVIGAGIAAVPSGPGQFVAAGVTGPRRFELATGSSEGWYIKSARVNGRDALTIPFDFGLAETVFRDVEVVVSPGGAALDGAALDDRLRPVVDYTVVLFSTQRDDWYPRSQRVRVVASGADGRFRIISLPPGDYYIVAAPGAERTDAIEQWQDPSVLEQLAPVAERLSVSEGDRLSPRLRVLGR